MFNELKKVHKKNTINFIKNVVSGISNNDWHWVLSNLKWATDEVNKLITLEEIEEWYDEGNNRHRHKKSA